MKLRFKTIGRAMQERKELRVKRRTEKLERRKLKDVIGIVYNSDVTMGTLVKKGMHITHKMEIDRLVLAPTPETYPESAERKMQLREEVYDVTLLNLCDRIDLNSARKLVAIVREIEGISENEIAHMQKKREKSIRIGYFNLIGGICLGMGVMHLIAPQVSYDQLVGVVTLVVSAAMFYMAYLINKRKDQTKDDEKPKE